jgi:hypothetical protein
VPAFWKHQLQEHAVEHFEGEHHILNKNILVLKEGDVESLPCVRFPRRLGGQDYDSTLPQQRFLGT